MRAKHGKRIRRATRQYNAEEREQLIREYEASGLKRQEFAERKGINVLTFHSWFRKSQRAGTVRNNPVKFAEVAISVAPGRGISTVVELANGKALRIEGLSVKELGGLIREVCSC